MEIILLLGLVLGFYGSWHHFCRSDEENGRTSRKFSDRFRVREARIWFCKRFSLKERFGLSLTIGLAVALIAGWIFGELADEILEEELLTQLDLTFGQGLLGLVTETTSQIFYAVTMIASPIVLIVGVVMISLWLVKRQQIADVIMLVTAVGGGAVINLTLKLLFSRPRPEFLDMFYQEIGYSFPSGHAMLSLLFYGMLAYLIGRNLSSWGGRIGLIVIAILVTLVVGFSRLVLGVHFLSDVLGGWAAGIVWLSACITAREISEG